MKHKMINLVNATDVIKVLTTKHYSNWNIVVEISKLYKKINEYKDIYLEQEKQLIQKYADKDESGKLKPSKEGNITFKDVSSANQFRDELLKLQNTEIDDIDSIRIYTSDLDDKPLTPEEYMQLDELVLIDDSKQQSSEN